MKFRQVSEHIFALSTWMIVPIHVWLVKNEGGLTLVDGGIGPMARGILRAVDRINRGPITRIVLTHGHVDHVGGIDAILKAGEAPVLVHPEEVPYMEGRQPYPGRKKAQQTVRPGVVTALEDDGTGGVSYPQGLDSRDGLIPYHTPGHSPGHVVYYHPVDGVVLGGDLFTSRRGELRPPIAMFTSDMAQAVRSAGILERLKPRRLEVCHGGPVMNPAEQLPRYVEQYS
jgi:glyoxylase-like metal-dependent hydrolase (beta-lactamase superfamily II)